MPFMNSMNSIMEQSAAMHRHNQQMAYALSRLGHPIPPEPQTSGLYIDQVSQGTELDAWLHDEYQDPSATGSGGTGGVPVVEIDSPSLTDTLTQYGVPHPTDHADHAPTGHAPQKGGLQTHRVRLYVKQPQPRKEDDNDGTSSKKGDKDDKDGKDDDKPDDKHDKDGDKGDDK